MVVKRRKLSATSSSKYAFDEGNDSDLTEFVRSFGVLVKEARQKVKITQEELAVRSGVDRSHISDIERGINAPSLIVLFKLARGLDVDPSSLLCRHQHYNCEKARKQTKPCEQLF